MRGTTYGFSLDDPERWYTSLLCALEARTVDQVFVLSALTLLPTAGDGLGLSLGVLGALCEGARGNYRESLTRLRDAIGERRRAGGCPARVRRGLRRVYHSDHAGRQRRRFRGPRATRQRRRVWQH